MNKKFWRIVEIILFSIVCISPFVFGNLGWLLTGTGVALIFYIDVEKIIGE